MGERRLRWEKLIGFDKSLSEVCCEGQNQVIEVELAPPLLEQKPAQKMLANGSSITYGGGGSAANRESYMLTASQLRIDMINLSIGCQKGKG